MTARNRRVTRASDTEPLKKKCLKGGNNNITPLQYHWPDVVVVLEGGSDQGSGWGGHVSWLVSPWLGATRASDPTASSFRAGLIFAI